MCRTRQKQPHPAKHGRDVQIRIPVENWYKAIRVRRSRRIYDGRPLGDGLLDALNRVCAEFTPFPGARAVLVDSNPEAVFKGAVGHYGQIKNAPAYIAFVGDMRERHVQERVGYLGEGIILEATHLGLATCWVGGFFRPEVAASGVGTAGHERVLAVTPVGFVPDEYSFEERLMSGFGRHHKRRDIRELTTGLPSDVWPEWVGAALAAARLAPSAVNRQPWRFDVGERKITVSVDNEKDTFGISKRLDCGIAMLHLELGALYHGVSGMWRFLDPPQVAEFSVSG